MFTINSCNSFILDLDPEEKAEILKFFIEAYKLSQAKRTAENKGQSITDANINRSFDGLRLAWNLVSGIAKVEGRQPKAAIQGATNGFSNGLSRGLVAAILGAVKGTFDGISKHTAKSVIDDFMKPVLKNNK